MGDPIKKVAGETGFTLADVEGVLKQAQEVMKEDILGPLSIWSDSRYSQCRQVIHRVD